MGRGFTTQDTSTSPAVAVVNQSFVKRFFKPGENPIGKRMAEFITPHYLRIGGYWYPRGGMPIDVFWQTGTCPRDVWLPDQGVPPYRGRG